MQTRPDREARSSLASMNSHSSMPLMRGTPVLLLIGVRRKLLAGVGSLISAVTATVAGRRGRETGRSRPSPHDSDVDVCREFVGAEDGDGALVG